MARFIARIATVLAAFLATCGAYHTGGSVVLRQNSTTFITKFCYSFNTTGTHRSGLLKLTVHAPAMTREHNAHIVLFDDEAGSYPGPSADWDSMSCEERLHHSRLKRAIDWTRAAEVEGQTVEFHIRQKLRPRFWYAALINCVGQDGEQPLRDFQVDFEAHLTNPLYGWASEFSTDRRYVLHMLFVLLVVYVPLFGAQVHTSRCFSQKSVDDSAISKAAHPFLRILSIGVALGLVEVLLSILHTVIFAQNGVGLPLLSLVAQLLATTSNFVLASLLLLVSEGKCISCRMVSPDAWRMLRLLGPFLFSCFILETWAEKSTSQLYTADYVYTTPFGWALICVELFLLGVYGRNLMVTSQAEYSQEDSVFYKTWGVAYGAWFLALPITAVLAQAFLCQYAWFMISFAVKKGTTAAMYSALVVGLWPGNASSSWFKLDPASHKVLPGAHMAPAPSRAGFPSLLGNMARKEDAETKTRPSQERRAAASSMSP